MEDLIEGENFRIARGSGTGSNYKESDVLG